VVFLSFSLSLSLSRGVFPQRHIIFRAQRLRNILLFHRNTVANTWHGSPCRLCSQCQFAATRRFLGPSSVWLATPAAAIDKQSLLLCFIISKTRTRNGLRWRQHHSRVINNNNNKRVLLYWCIMRHGTHSISVIQYYYYYYIKRSPQHRLYNDHIAHHIMMNDNGLKSIRWYHNIINSIAEVATHYDRESHPGSMETQFS